MAGRIQKPYDQLQNKRGGRRAPALALTTTQRDAAIDASIAAIDRAFAGETSARQPSAPRPKWKRKYTPRTERKPNPAKAARAAARPRDEKGHFLPSTKKRGNCERIKS